MWHPQVLIAAHAIVALPEDVSSELVGSLLGPRLTIQDKLRRAARAAFGERGWKRKLLAVQSMGGEQEGSPLLS